METTTVRTELTTLGYDDQRHIAHSEPQGGGGRVQVLWFFFFFFFCPVEAPSDSAGPRIQQLTTPPWERLAR